MQYFRRKNIKGYALEGTPQVNGKGPDGPCMMAFIGEAPSRTEVDEGRPFVGDAGEYLNKGLAKVGIYRGGVWLTNVITVQPPGNDIKSDEGQEALKAQREGFWEEIEYLVRDKECKVIVALGNTALHAFGIYDPISKARGSVYEINLSLRAPVGDPEIEECDFILIPSFHPSYLMRKRWVGRKKGSSDQLLFWLEDIHKAKDLAEGGYTRPVERFNIFPTVSEVIEYVNKAIANKYLIALDIETTGLDPYKHEIVCISLAASGEDAIVVPILKNGGGRYWSTEGYPYIINALNALFTSCNLMVQNGLFDLPFLIQKGFTINLKNFKQDTLILYSTIDAEAPHNLAHITSLYGVTAYWKGEFSNRFGTILSMKDKDLRTYNARDSIVLHQILPGLLEDLNKKSTEAVYYEESMPLTGPVIQMMVNGVMLDERALKVWKKRVDEKVRTYTRDLRESIDLPDAFSLSSTVDLGRLLFNYIGSKYNKVEDIPKKKDKTTKLYKNLLGLKDILDMQPLWIIPKSGPGAFNPRKTPGGIIPTTDEKGRLALQVGAQNRLEHIEGLVKPTQKHIEERAGIVRLLTWLALYNTFSQWETFKERYTKFPVQADGRVHTHYSMHITPTGRLASSGPNLQNLPKEEKAVRRCFRAKPGHLLVSLDYVNLEVRTMAYETREPNLIKIFAENLNMHDLNTEALFGITKDNPMWGPARRAAKTFQFGSLSYGGGDQEVYSGIILEVPELNLTMKQFKIAKARYMAKNPVYAAWRDNIREIMSNSSHPSYRILTNAFGRKRIFHGNQYDAFKQGLNFPNQSGAAHIINKTTVELQDKINIDKWPVKLILQVHDELIFEVPYETVEPFIPMAKHMMERPFMMYEIERIFPVDADIGHNWGDLESYTPESLQKLIGEGK